MMALPSAAIINDDYDDVDDDDDDDKVMQRNIIDGIMSWCCDAG